MDREIDGAAIGMPVQLLVYPIIPDKTKDNRTWERESIGVQYQDWQKPNCQFCKTFYGWNFGSYTASNYIQSGGERYACCSDCSRKVLED